MTREKQICLKIFSGVCLKPQMTQLPPYIKLTPEFNYQLPSHRRRRKEAQKDSIAATKKKWRERERERERERDPTKKMPKTQNFFVLCKILLLLLLPHMIYYP